jgi:hypothetical protein
VVNACGAAQSRTAVVTVKISAFPPLEAQLQRVENSFIFYTRFVNRLTWQANPANVVPVTNYRIYRKVKGADDSTYQLTGEVSGSTLGYDDRGLNNNDFFAYRITSVNERGDESTPVELRIKGEQHEENNSYFHIYTDFIHGSIWSGFRSRDICRSQNGQ